MPGRAADDGRDAAAEAALVEAARHDPEALRALYREYMPRVYAYVAYRVRSVPDAEDVTSEAFLRVARELPRFRYLGEGSFAAWLFRIVNNLLADQHRRRRGGRELPLEAAADVADA